MAPRRALQSTRGFAINVDALPRIGLGVHWPRAAAGICLAAAALGSGVAAAELIIPPVVNAPRGKVITSDPVKITGLQKVALISIVGGEYALNRSAFRSAPALVSNGAVLRVRVQAPDTFASKASARVIVGGTQTAQFVVTTRGIVRIAKLAELFDSELAGAQIVDGRAVIGAKIAAVLKANPPAGAIVETTVGASVTTADGKLTLTDLLGGSSLSFTTFGNATIPLVAQGRFDIRFGAGGNAFALEGTAGNSLITTTGEQDSLIVERGDSQTSAYVATGAVKLDYPGVSLPGGPVGAASINVYGGETAEIDNAGLLSRLRIGSLSGDRGLPGDPLSLPKVASDVAVPRLNGSVPRLGNAGSLLTVVQQGLNARFGVSSSQIGYDQSNGVVSYVAAGKSYRFIPLGSPTIQLGGAVAGGRSNRFAASSVSTSANGAFSLASQGIELTLASALGYFSDLDQALKAADPNANIQLRDNGVLQLNLAGVGYITTPAAQTATGQAGPPAFLVDASGYYAFQDSTGAVQLLYPAFADTQAVDLTVKAADPNGAVTAGGNGTALMVLQGSSQTLLPDYRLIALPQAHSGDLWWQDGALQYIRYTDDTAQGFTVQ